MFWFFISLFGPANADPVTWHISEANYYKCSDKNGEIFSYPNENSRENVASIMGQFTFDEETNLYSDVHLEVFGDELDGFTFDSLVTLEENSYEGKEAVREARDQGVSYVAANIDLGDGWNWLEVHKVASDGRSYYLWLAWYRPEQLNEVMTARANGEFGHLYNGLSYNLAYTNGQGTITLVGIPKPVEPIKPKPRKCRE